MMLHAISSDLTQRFRSDLARCGVADDRLGLAVSGGPDSLGLLLIAAAALPGRICAATVDHGLRPEAAQEALFVADVCSDLGVPHATLKVEVEPVSSIQRAARNARYRALGGWLTAQSIGFLATAHHIDDQAETLMMRLLRGSGVAGLAGVRATGRVPGHDDAMVVRPLLGWRRTELAEIVDAADLKAIDDPSNRDPRFDRVRIRQLLATTPWIDPAPLARSAAALAEADFALKWLADQLYQERVSADGPVLSLTPHGLPSEMKRRLLIRIIGTFGPGSSPRGDDLARLLDQLEAGATATLAGIKFTGGEVWRCEAAPAHRQNR